jgi:hypothetical protein
MASPTIVSDLLATVIAAPTTHSVAGTHVCACAEELGRAGIGFNSMVTTLPSVTKAGGQPNPNKQGRAVPHNKATIKAGTSDGWIRESEIDTTTTGISSEDLKSEIQNPKSKNLKSCKLEKLSHKIHDQPRHIWAISRLFSDYLAIYAFSLYEIL